MINLNTIIILISALFIIFVILRSYTPIKVCALCTAVFSTWILLLTLFYAGLSIDPLLIGILMGGSIVGSMYLLERKLPEKYTVFKLPFFLSLISIVYFLLNKEVILGSVIIVGGIWIIFVIFYLNNEKRFIQKIIKCCRNW